MAKQGCGDSPWVGQGRSLEAVQTVLAEQLQTVLAEELPCLAGVGMKA